MPIEHKDITDAERHPPKGASTASAGEQIVSDGAGGVIWEIPEPKGADTALAGEIYVSDGAGSGTWQRRSGYNAINSTLYTSGSPLSIGAGVRTKLLMNKAGLDVGQGDVDAWDTVANKFVTEGFNYCYGVRLVFKCNPAASNPRVKIEYDIGGAGPSDVILSKDEVLRQSTTNDFEWHTQVFTRATFVANGMEIYLTPTNSTTFWDFSWFVTRQHAAY